MKSDTLRLMARELTEMVKNMPKLDWTQRESVRATLRRNVRRLLAKYGYPPDLADNSLFLTYILHKIFKNVHINSCEYAFFSLAEKWNVKVMDDQGRSP
jgi:hypothetical protein